MTITLPWPPSVNTYYRTYKNRTILSETARRYKKAACLAIATIIKTPPMYTGRLEVELHLAPPDRRRRDIDNYGKATLDALQAAGIFKDDGQIDRLFFYRLDITTDPHVIAIITTI
jgi:crossover junction endodeoxyribonuclease RusA